MLPPVPVPPDRARHYVNQRLWDDRTLADGIESAARTHPDRTAVVDNRRSLSFAELADAVAAGVRQIRRSGVAAGEPVMLVCGNSIEGVVAYHSLLRIGAVAVVLDRRCGPADLVAAYDATDPRLSIVAASLGASLLAAGLPGRQLPLEELGVPASRDVEPQWSEPDRDGVAAVMFTSGTTSRPKAVTHSINTLTAGARNMALATGSGSEAVIFLVSPLTSITGIMQMHMAADLHAALVLEDAFDPAGALDRLNQERATLIGGAPVIVERLLAAADAGPDRRLTLRVVALGGSMLPRSLLDRVTDEYGVTVARVYGSSEAPNSTGSMPDDSSEMRLADDGAPLPGTEVRVGSSSHAQECLLRGPNLFLGYLDPVDNAGAFEDGWFRTGDMVELSAQGRLTVLGRLKEVVDRNGLKISLAEIDAALEGAPGIEECASFARPDPVTGERLAVAVRPSGNVSPTLAELGQYLQLKGLAKRKFPEELVVWDGPLPRTASGKVIRSRLTSEATGKMH